MALYDWGKKSGEESGRQGRGQGKAGHLGEVCRFSWVLLTSFASVFFPVSDVAVEFPCVWGR